MTLEGSWLSAYLTNNTKLINKLYFSTLYACSNSNLCNHYLIVDTWSSREVYVLPDAIKCLLCSLLVSVALHAYSHSSSPGEAPPGTGQRAENGSEGQSREKRVKGEVEQSLHPIVAQAFQRVNIVLKSNG